MIAEYYTSMKNIQ